MAHPLSFIEQTGLDFKNPAFKKELDNLQANILKGHGRNNVNTIFLQFKEDEKASIWQWIQQLKITSAYKQLDDTYRYKEDISNNVSKPHDGGPVFCFFLTATGYRKLGISDGPSLPAGEAFRDGMKTRNKLNDPEIEKWQPEYQLETDAMLLIADESKRLRMVTRSAIDVIETTAGISINIVQKGEALKEGDLGIEHFGYADALSQPQYLNDYTPGNTWDDTTALHAVLVPDPAAIGPDGKADKTCYGSYFVFRKLEQRVKAFKELEELLGDTLNPRQPDEELKEVAGAYAVGRFENSSPVVKHQQPKQFEEGKTPEPDNDFDYGINGDVSRCPYHAHIRLTNPRKSDLTAMEKAIPRYIAPERITRRGIPFDEAGRNGNMSWLPEGNVGLLFMAYQYNLEKCFETMQKSANLADGIIGQQTNTRKQLWPIQWGNEAYQLKGFGFSGFVTMKGGEYFFAPSIPFLKSLKITNRTNASKL
jgi:Dyp-type peroxidase family